MAYLGIVFSGIFAEFFVRMSVVEAGNPSATAVNIANSSSLFRAGLAADALMIALDVCVAIGLYVLLRNVHRPLALLAAALRLVQASVLGANLMNMAEALRWATAGRTQTSLDASTTAEMALSAMELHRVVYDLGLIFFGLSCLILGRLLWTSGQLPKVLAAGLSISGGIYLVGSFTLVLAPHVAATLDPMYGFTVLAELAVAGFLTFNGIRKPDASRANAVPARSLTASV